MKINQNILNKSLGEVRKALQSSNEQTDLTFGEVMQLLSIMETAANIQAKFQNPQSIPSDLELKVMDLSRRITMLESKFSAIYEAFTGGHDYGKDGDQQ